MRPPPTPHPPSACAGQADIGKRVEEKISKDQRRYFLMEQVRGGAAGCFFACAHAPPPASAAPHTHTHTRTRAHTNKLTCVPSLARLLQLKSIKQELGLEKDEKTALVQK